MGVCAYKDPVRVSSQNFDVPDTLRHDESMHGLANCFVRVELLMWTNSRDPFVVGSATIDLGLALVWPQKQLERPFKVTLSLPGSTKVIGTPKDIGLTVLLEAEISLSLHVNKPLGALLERARLFELQSAACESIPYQWTKELFNVRYALCFPIIAGDGRPLQAHSTLGATSSGPIRWPQLEYPHDIVSYGEVRISSKAPCFRAFVSDAAAIQLRAHLKQQRPWAAVLERQKKVAGQRGLSVWQMYAGGPCAIAPLNLAKLLRPGNAAMSGAAPVQGVADVDSAIVDGHNRDNGNDAIMGRNRELDLKTRAKTTAALEEAGCSIFIAFKFSHPLLGLCKDAPELKSKLQISRFLSESCPRPKLIKFAAMEEQAEFSLRRELDVVAASVATDYVKLMGQGGAPSTVDEQYRTLERQLMSEGKYEALSLRLRSAVVRIVRERFVTGNSGSGGSDVFFGELFAYLMEAVEKAIERVLGREAAARPEELNIREALALEAELYGDKDSSTRHHQQLLALTTEGSGTAAAAAAAWQRYGNFKSRMGLSPEALGCFEEAISRARRPPVALLLAHAATLAELSQRTSAVSATKRCLAQPSIAPSDAALGYALLGLCYELGCCFSERDSAMEAAGAAHAQTRAAAGGDVKGDKVNDALHAQVRLTGWLQVHRLVKLSTKALALLAEVSATHKGMTRTLTKHISALQARQLVLDGNYEAALSLGRQILKTPFNASEESGPVVAAAALVVAEVLRDTDSSAKNARTNEEELKCWRLVEASVAQSPPKSSPSSRRRRSASKEEKDDSGGKGIAGSISGDIPHRLRASVGVGILQLASADSEKAKATFIRLTKEQPLFARAWVGVARASMQLGELEAAMEALCEANARDNRSAGIYGWMAALCLAYKPARADQAAQFMQQAFRHRLTDAPLLRRLGKDFAARGDKTIARRALRRSLAIDKGNKEALGLLQSLSS